MKKAMVFVLICLVWGWTPSSGTTVISPAAESGTRSAWLSLLQGAGLAPESLDLTRGLLRLGKILAMFPCSLFMFYLLG